MEDVVDRAVRVHREVDGCREVKGKLQMFFRRKLRVDILDRSGWFVHLEAFSFSRSLASNGAGAPALLEPFA